MNFKPMTEHEARQAQVNTFDPGRYRGLVTRAESKISKSGNPMLEVDCEFHVGTNKPRRVRDWIMLDGPMAWKLREFAAACGRLEQYESGKLQDTDLEGATLEADIIIEEGDGDYPDRNRVQKYHQTAPQAYTAKAQHEPTKPVDRDPDEIPEDDIPF